MKKKLFLTMTLGFLSGPALSQAENADWTVRLLGVPDVCISCSDTKAQTFEADKIRFDIAKQWIESEMKRISAWMADMGYEDPHFPLGKEKTVRIVNTKRFRNKRLAANWQGTAGQFSAEDGLEASFAAFMEKAGPSQPPYSKAHLINNSDTLAHELYHAVQYASGDQTEDDWHVEGISSAVGYAWTQKNFKLQLGRTESYSEPLTKPEDPYTLGEFFFEIGRMMDATEPVSYLAGLNKGSANDGAKGVIWLDEYLKTRGDGLAGFYPEFIAKIATKREQFKIDSSEKDVDPLTELSAGETAGEERTRRSIPELAARYSDVAPKLNGDWSAIPDEDRLFIAALRLESADRPEDLRLIVEKEIYRSNQTHLLAFYGEAGTLEKPWATRISNIAERAHISRPQDVSLVLEVQNVGLEVPDCVSAGQTVPLNWETNLASDELSKAMEKSEGLQASAGNVDEHLMFTAPNSASQVEFSLKVARLGGGKKKIVLGETEVSASECMIRMIAGPAFLTYASEGDYTEFSDPASGAAMYLKEEDLAVWEGGWMRVPPQGKAMILGGMTKNMGQVMGGQFEAMRKETGVDAFYMHRMPKIFSQRFAWKNLRHAKLNGRATKRVPTACISGSKGCTSVDFSMDGNTVNVIMNSQGRPEQVVFDGQPIRFEYGGFNIRRPSNW